MFNPDRDSHEGEESEKEISRQGEAEKLQTQLQEKSFTEKYISEVQTRKAPIRGAENPDQTRGGIFRLERGQILKGYKILRGQIRDAEKRGEDATGKIELLKEIRIRAKDLERNLDEIERQSLENIKMLDVETEFGKFSVPVVEFNLGKNSGKEEGAEAEKDDRIPYFFIPGMATFDFHHSASAAVPMALALQGHKVYVPMDIEQPSVKRPEGYREMLRAQGNLGIHAEVFKQLIRKIGLEKVNIISHSFGATVALEMGSDADFKELEDLVVTEPLGIEDKGVGKLAVEFGLDQGILKQLPYSESRIKMKKEQGVKKTGDNSLYLEDVKIIARKIYDQEKLSRIKPNGRFQIWFGTDSPVINVEEMEKAFQEAEKLRQKDLKASPLEIYEVQKGEHIWPIRNALGFSRMLKQERPGTRITKIQPTDLGNSAMEEILTRISEEQK